MIEALVLIANGSEESETVITVDVLRRAGFKVVIASVAADSTNGRVTGSNDIVIVPDTSLEKMESGVKLSKCAGDDQTCDMNDPKGFDILVIPGGSEGVETLCKSNLVLELVRFYMGEKRIVAAICAGPLVILEAGVGKGYEITAYPSLDQDKKFSDHFCFKSGARVWCDHNLVTGSGPASSFEFALRIIECICPGSDKRVKVAKEMLVE